MTEGFDRSQADATASRTSPNGAEGSASQVQSYYETIASQYDDSRFGNTYGQYVDRQEQTILRRWLGNSSGQSILDLGCGTGRLLHFASAGLDSSPAMLEIARSKHPAKPLMQGSAAQLPIESASYDAIFSFHLLMHLQPEQIRSVLDECYRVLKPGGTLIFDIPSAARRRLVAYQSSSWHAATSLSLADIRAMLNDRWQLTAYAGVMLFPIHRIPAKLRLSFLPIDQLLCWVGLKAFASYYVVRAIRL